MCHFLVGVPECLSGRPHLARRVEGELPKVFCGHPRLQFDRELGVSAQQFLPVGNFACRDGFGITIEEDLQGQSICTRPSGDRWSGLQITQQDFPQPPGGIIRFRAFAMHVLFPLPFGSYATFPRRADRTPGRALAREESAWQQNFPGR